MVMQSPNKEVKKKRTRSSLPDAHGPKRGEHTETRTAPSPNPQIGHPKREDGHDHDPKTGGDPGHTLAPAVGSVLGQRSIKDEAEKEMRMKMLKDDLQKTREEIVLVRSLVPNPGLDPERGDADVPAPNPGPEAGPGPGKGEKNLGGNHQETRWSYAQKTRRDAGPGLTLEKRRKRGLHKTCRKALKTVALLKT